MSANPSLSAETKFLVDETENRVTSQDLDVFERVDHLREGRKHHATIISAWKQQQIQDRKMRKKYATWLLIAMSGQILSINLIFLLLGLGGLKYEPWTANTFIMAVFAEVAALVLLVVKYLFPPSTDKILDLIDRFKR